MSEPKVTYKKKKFYDNKKKKDFVKKKFKSNKIIDNRQKVEKGQKFDKGPKFKWQKINGRVRCPKCNIVFLIGKLVEFRCTWCGMLIWTDRQHNNYMTESD